MNYKRIIEAKADLVVRRREPLYKSIYSFCRRLSRHNRGKRLDSLWIFPDGALLDLGKLQFFDEIKWW